MSAPPRRVARLPQAGILVPAYCIISCDEAPLSILKQYIEQQDNPD